MRVLGKAFLALLVAATGLSAQHGAGSSGVAPKPIGSFGGVVSPGGASAMSGGQRGFGSVVFPGGGRILVPNSRMAGTGLPGGARGSGLVYAYPVYVGGYYDSSCIYPAEQPAAQAPPGQDGAPAYSPAVAPVLITPSSGGDAQAPGEQSDFGPYQPDATEPVERPATEPAEPVQYLLAFKDRTIYSTPAYWVDGDTIHYFTAGNKHNQASVSLIDRELTQRLNAESGVEVELPRTK
jgi:hypothetical protein